MSENRKRKLIMDSSRSIWTWIVFFCHTINKNAMMQELFKILEETLTRVQH